MIFCVIFLKSNVNLRYFFESLLDRYAQMIIYNGEMRGGMKTPFLMIFSSFLHDLEPGRCNITWGIRISRSQSPEMLKTMRLEGKTVEVLMEIYVFVGVP